MDGGYDAYPLLSEQAEPVDDREVGRTRRARAKARGKTGTRYERTGYIADVVLGFNRSNAWGGLGATRASILNR